MRKITESETAAGAQKNSEEETHFCDESVIHNRKSDQKRLGGEISTLSRLIEHLLLPSFYCAGISPTERHK